MDVGKKVLSLHAKPCGSSVSSLLLITGALFSFTGSLTLALTFSLQTLFLLISTLSISDLSAWASLDGGFMPDLNSLCIARHNEAILLILSDMSIRHCYSFLLSRCPPTPHCEAHFAAGFGLYWAATWKQVHLFPLDRPHLEICPWGVIHCQAPHLLWVQFHCFLFL